MENRSRISTGLMTPFLIAIGGAVLAIVADFIQYLTASYGFLSRKTSIFRLIKDCIDRPSTFLGKTEDKVIFGIILAGVAASLLSLLFVFLKKMKAVIVFSIVTSLPFLLIGNAWIHYLGVILSLIGAIWYLIANKKLTSNNL